MAKRLYTAFLISLILAAAAAAQTTATTGGVAGTTLANPYGAVTLRGIAPAPATAAAGPKQRYGGYFFRRRLRDRRRDRTGRLCHNGLAGVGPVIDGRDSSALDLQ